MKPIRMIPVLLSLLLLGGCAFPSGDELLAAPKPSTNYQTLQMELENLLNSGVSYTAPTDGENRSSIQLVDLDSDGENEIFAVVVGSYTSGSGGSSALWCAEQDGELVVKQAFTLVNMPVIVVDNEDGGAKNLILERSGGGAEAETVLLTFDGKNYCSVSDAEPIEDVSAIEGTAILCDDLAADMQSGDFMTLAD